jgi:dethiobiotin synthetase
VAARGLPSDAVTLQRAAGAHQPLETVNLFRFESPLAPAIAAIRERRRAPFSRVLAQFQRFGRQPLVVEGAGGLHVPLDGTLEVIDAIEAMRLPVVVVARAGLGTLNHVTLTLEALTSRRASLAGVVLVQTSAADDPSIPFNRPALERRFPRVRFLGPVPFCRGQSARSRAFERVVEPLVG